MDVYLLLNDSDWSFELIQTIISKNSLTINVHECLLMPGCKVDLFAI